MLRELDEISQEWRSRVNARADSSVWQLTELLFRQPAVNSTIVQERLHVSKQTALNSIGQLEEAGVLLKAKGEERNRAWVAIDIVTVLDRFAERSGRRTHRRQASGSLVSARAPDRRVEHSGTSTATHAGGWQWSTRCHLSVRSRQSRRCHLGERTRDAARGLLEAVDEGANCSSLIPVRDR